MTDKKQDSKFLIFAAITVVFIYGLMNFPSNSSTQLPPPPQETVDAVKAEMRPIDALALREKLQLTDKNTMLFIYTSWCPHCRKAIPELLKLKENGSMDHMQVVMLSIDQNPEQLINYIGNAGYHTRFTPYLYTERIEGDMWRLVADYNMTFKGAIPYAAVISKDGELLAETTSGNGWEDIDAQIQRK